MCHHLLPSGSNVGGKRPIETGSGFQKKDPLGEAPPSAFAPSLCAVTNSHHFVLRRRVFFSHRHAALVPQGQWLPPRPPSVINCFCAAQLDHSLCALLVRRGGGWCVSGGRRGEKGHTPLEIPWFLTILSLS